MDLKETTFSEFLDFVNREKRTMSGDGISVGRYLTDTQLKIMYEHMKAKGLVCKGRKLTITYNGDWVCSLCQPLEHEPKREDFVWTLFHEVWCKTEWAVRCGRSPQELGYKAVKADFGQEIIKQLNEAGRSV